MYLMYVDDSGDPGLVNSPTRYYILSGLVVHELRWQSYFDQLIDFRRRLRDQFGIRLREEIHSSAFLSHPGLLLRIPKHERLLILRLAADELASMSDLNIINVVVDKQGKPGDYEVFEMAWKVLIQRFENTIARRNFVGPANPDERGMIFSDHTDDKKLRALLRKMRRYNPIPNHPTFGPGFRDLHLRTVVEDPNFRDSQEYYYIQAADLAAFLLYQHLTPNVYMRKKGGANYFARLGPVLCKAVSRDQLGLVRL